MGKRRVNSFCFVKKFNVEAFQNPVSYIGPVKQKPAEKPISVLDLIFSALDILCCDKKKSHQGSMFWRDRDP